MRIKKDKGTKNEWIYADSIWVRNFTKNDSNPININTQISKDYQCIIQNSILNNTLNLPNISDEKFSAKNVIIISDGYRFKEKHKIISKLQNVVVLAVNKALSKWDIALSKNINAFVVNNPYIECMSYINNKYYPVCITSNRTNNNFIKNYKGSIFSYDPIPEINFGQMQSRNYYIDDYRNPICASICLAYRMGVEKIMLMCCDDSFEKERPGSYQLPNGLWSYPQQNLSHSIIDANLYWLSKQKDKEIQIVDYSSGLEYKNASYIKCEEEVINFFDTTKT